MNNLKRTGKHIGG